MQLSNRSLGFAMIGALALVAVAYGSTLQSIVAKWLDDATYSHGLLVVPIAVWLAWRQRKDFAVVRLQPSALGVVALLVCAAAWVVARGVGILVVEQFAALAMVPAAVLAVLGTRAARTLAFPLAFLMLAVPFGKGLVPWLMQVTADLSMIGLRLTGIPAYRDAMFISVPAGEFEVARACSGLNYVITGLVLGTLYAYLTYRTWPKRLLFIVASIVVPILANGLRAYLTIAVAHWTDMQYGIGTDHIIFGQVLFIIVIVAMFWIGLRWRDSEPGLPFEPAMPSAASHAPAPRGGLIVLFATFLILGLTPLYLKNAIAHSRLDGASAAQRLAWPATEAPWSGPYDSAFGWRPAFSGAAAEQAAGFATRGGTVEVYVGLYALGASSGAEMITYTNRIHPISDLSLLPENDVTVPLPQGGFMARETTVPGSTPQLVWYWYQVGDRKLLRDYHVKAREALEFLTQGASDERIVSLATPLQAGGEEEARAILREFVETHVLCVTSGFEAEACR